MDDQLAKPRPANHNAGDSDNELADEQPVLETNKKSNDEDAPRSSTRH